MTFFKFKKDWSTTSSSIDRLFGNKTTQKSFETKKSWLLQSKGLQATVEDISKTNVANAEILRQKEQATNSKILI